MSGLRATDREVNVLIIDDDEDDYQIICDLLADIESGSYGISWESSYESGLARLDSDRFDVCLAGYCIGGRTGKDFLQSANETGASCPIILLSGVTHQGIDAATALAGVAGFLNKSELTPDIVRESIDRAVTSAGT